MTLIKQDKVAFVGRQHLHFTSINSTNNFFSDFEAVKVDQYSFTVSTDFQTDGVGQRGNFWESEICKNLLFTIYTFPKFFETNNLFAINKIVSISILEILQELDVKDVTIKWPNDILVGNKKIAGILLKNSIQGQFVKSLGIGIGLNVNQEKFSQFERKATSLKIEKGVILDRFKILEAIKKRINKYYKLLISNSTVLNELYLKNLYQFDEWHSYLINGNQKKAKIVGVNKDGDLNLNTFEGESLKVGIKEIVFL